MVWRSDFFIDQVGQQLFSRVLILALGVHGRKIRRERGDMMIVLSGVVCQRLRFQLRARPGKIKWMLQQMLRRNVVVNLIEICLHQFFSRIGLEPQIDTDFHRLKKQNHYLCFICG
jgi:hypothetical protein